MMALNHKNHALDILILYIYTYLPCRRGHEDGEDFGGKWGKMIDFSYIFYLSK